MNARRIYLSSLMAAALFAGIARAQVPSYVITDLGSLDANISNSLAEGISSTGFVTGGSKITAPSGGNPFTRAFLYYNGTMVDLGTALSGNNAYGFGINSTGSVAGNSTQMGRNIGHPTIRLPGMYIILDTNTAFSGNTHAITDNGRAAGDAPFSKSSGGGGGGGSFTDSHAFAYVGGKVIFINDLGSTRATSPSAGLGINSTGMVVGYSTVSNNTVNGIFAFTSSSNGGNATNLGLLDGGENASTPSSYAWGINDSGVVVGNSTATGGTLAFIYQGGSMFPMGGTGALQGGFNASANSVNNDGDAVGTSDSTSLFGKGATRPFLYQHGPDISSGTMLDLSNSVELNASHSITGGEVSITGIDPANYTLISAKAINNFGQIVGQAQINGAFHGYLLTPTAEAQTPTIGTPTPDTVILAGSNLTLDSGITGGTPLVFKWTKNNAAINNQANSTLILTNLTVGSSGNYKAFASNLIGNISSTIKLTVVIQPNITRQPLDAGVIAGKVAKFTTIATGTAPLTYFWEVSFDGGSNWTTVVNGTDGVNGGTYTGATTATLSIANTTTDMSGYLYRSTVNNAINLPETSDPASLLVGIPPSGFSVAPLTSNLVENDPLTLTTTVNANTLPLTYSWSLNKKVVVGETNSTLQVDHVNATNVGTYTVTVSNAVGSASASAKVAVTLFPNITVQPHDAFIVTGKPAKFTLTATGTAKITYQWQVKPPAGSFTDIPKATSNTLTIAKTDVTMDGNQYHCVLDNPAPGTVTSDDVTLHLGAAPAIGTQPLGFTATVGTNPTLTVATSAGNATIHYQWLKGKVVEGTDADTLTFTNIQTTDAGSYTVKVSNDFGAVTSKPAVVKVVAAPAFVTQPTDATVVENKPAKFTVKVATGNKIQWMMSPDGIAPFTPIAKATAVTYTITKATLAMDGNKFKCVITNAAGTTLDSNVVTLTVTPAP